MSNGTRWLWQVIFALLGVSRLSAQFVVTLQPQTIRDFDAYAGKVEQQLSSRWRGAQRFLSIEDDPNAIQNVLIGEIVIRPGAPQSPVSVTNGLIHDWVGTVFIPNAKLEEVLSLLQNFNRHHEVYPAIIASKLISIDGNSIVGSWRLERKDPLQTVVLDVPQHAKYERIAPDKWICRAYAKAISEVQNPGTPEEKILPAGKGRGYLWRLYAYWSLEARNGGVLAENRALSLSRNVPVAFTWIVKPFLQTLPRQSLAETLQETRSAITKSTSAKDAHKM